MTELRHMPRPCDNCPWRRDAPAGEFTPDRWRALAATCHQPDTGSAPLGAPLFACHKTVEGREVACAGWLAVEGDGHVGVRLALLQGRLGPDALTPGEDWPPLYSGYAEVATVNGATP